MSYICHKYIIRSKKQLEKDAEELKREMEERMVRAGRHKWTDESGVLCGASVDDGGPYLWERVNGRYDVLAGSCSAAAEILRLAEENSALKAEPDFVALVARAVRDEGARIRRAMVEESAAFLARAELSVSPLSARSAHARIVEWLDRIVPGEG